jgi:uncharacterized protein YdhG (YjbR/CyaY superfamily)
MKSKIPPQSVDEYIAAYPEDLQKKLKDIRKIIRKAAPQAVEKISYGMPAYTIKGMLLYFAMHTNHIGLYPYPSAMEAFKKEVAEYRASKGTLKFPHNKKLPIKLIAEIVKFRVRENIMKEEQKTLKRRGNKQSG